MSSREREGEEDKRFPARKKEDKTQTPGRKNPQQRIAGTGIESNPSFGAPQLTSDYIPEGPLNSLIQTGVVSDAAAGFSRDENPRNRELE